MMAVEAGHTDTLKLLLEHGADINLKGSFGRTPLESAIGLGNAELVRLLLENGADVNNQGDYGTSHLKYAHRRYPEIEAILLRHGARRYVRLTDAQIRGMLKGLQQGYGVICHACDGDVKYENDRSGSKWHLLCPSGCIDYYWPI